MQNCVHAEVPGLLYWGELHKFLVNAPAAAATATVAAYSYISSAVWTGSKVAGAFGYKAAAAVLAPLGTLLAWVGWVCASHTIQILAAVILFIAWQIYFPSRLLIRLLAKLPYCRGVSFEFAPAPDRPSGKYIALTIDDGPCPYNTSAVLNTLKDAGAKATFFIIGSHVEKCDVAGVGSDRNGGEGHYPLGQETLRRMYTEGHELGNHTWHDRPSHSLTPKQLTREIIDVHKIIHSARQAAVTAAFTDSDSDSTSNEPSSSSAVTGPRTKWFRPGWGWFTPELVDTAQKLGYHTVLGSVWPWDVYCKWPLLNALYVAAKVYPGAVVVLHDRRRHLLPTLQYVLPWLSHMGYDVVTLSEAAYRSNGRGLELTPAALEAHNKSHSSLSLASMNSARSLDSAPMIQPSAAYLARMAKENERSAMIAAMEEAERAHLKALKRAEADRRAGIDRKLVDMSAAEKRMIERREREKKEAEIRRARRKVEEAKARERYERYVKERAERHAREAKERAEAERKAKEADERRKVALEEYNKRKEAERKYAAEMVARQKAEREAKEAEEAAAAAATATAAAAGSSEITAAASEASEWTAADSSTTESSDKKKRKGLGLLKKIGSKAAQKLGVKEKSSSGSKGATVAAAAAAAAAVGVASAAALSSGAGEASVGPAACGLEPVAAESQVPDETYGWYGLTASPDSLAALAKVDAAVAAYTAKAAAGAELPPPAKGGYALGPSGRVLLGFDGEPLLLAKAEGPVGVGADGAEAHTVLLSSQGEPLFGSNGEKIVMLLGANSIPLADPHGRPVFVAEADEGRLLGVHPDGSIITVPAAKGSDQQVKASAGGSKGPEQHGSAAASRRVSSSSASGDVAAAMSAVHHSPSPSDGGSGSIKEASSYAPSLARTSVRSSVSGSTAGLPPRAPTPPPLPAAPSAAAAAAPEPAAVGSSAAAGVVPAQLLLGPSGRPLLGLDNRPLIVAVDEDGVPLVECGGGRLLLGPDGQALQLAYASDGTLVALDSMCRPLVGSDGCSHMVALDRAGRSMADESGRAIMLALNPAGFVVADAGDAGRVSWPGSPRDPRMSHSGNAAALLAASGGTAAAAGAAAAAVGADSTDKYDAFVGRAADSDMTVVDAADYGAYSYTAGAAAASVAAVGAVGVGAAVAVAGCDVDDSSSAPAAAGEVEVAAAASSSAFTMDEAEAEFGPTVQQEDDKDISLVRDQAATPTAAVAAAVAAAATTGMVAATAPASPAALVVEQEAEASGLTAAPAEVEPVGFDLFSAEHEQQQQLKEEEEEEQQPGGQQGSVEYDLTAGDTPLVQHNTPVQQQQHQQGVSSYALDSSYTLDDSDSYTGPVAADSDDESAVQPAVTGVGARVDGSYTGLAPHLQQGAVAGAEQQRQQGGAGDVQAFKPGKIMLSAQGVQLTASANSHY